jgi:glycosyltransferase involved in cell wall biosynthesis
MRVSVVIPLYNRRPFIVQTIESALAQTRAAHEVIVVDDGSTDGSADLVAATFGDRVRLIRLPVNQGRSSARNLAWALAEGELVAFLDSDDLWAPENLARQVPAFADPAVTLSHCWVAKIDANGQPLPEESAALAREFALALARGYDYGGITETWCRMYTSAVIVRRETLRTSGGFDTRISNFEDWDVLWRIARDGRVATLSEVLVSHRTHPGNTQTRWMHDAEPWLLVNRKHLAELATRPMTPTLQRARHNLLLNLSLGEYWRRHRWAARWWMWRALLVDPRPLRNPGYYMWSAPLLHAFLPRPVADALIRAWRVDPYSNEPMQVAS